MKNTLPLIHPLEFAVLLPLLILLSACTSAPERKAETQPPPPPVVTDSGEPTIDVLGLQRSLRLERPVTELGLEEKPFESCRVGYGYSSSSNCRRLYMSVFNLRLQCRDSEGTVSQGLSASDLTALAGADIEWRVGGANGVVRLDGEGYGQIVAIIPQPAKSQRVRLSSGSQFLYIRGGDLTRVVTPKPWCPNR
jgi:hypothetical protein